MEPEYDVDRLEAVERLLGDVAPHLQHMDEHRQQLTQFGHRVQMLGENVERVNRGRYTTSLMPSPFTGSSLTNAEAWLDRFAKFSDLQGHNNQDRLATFRLLMAARAETWFDGLPNATKQNWNALAAAFEEKFVNPPGLAFTRETEILARHQLESESVEKYATDILRRCAQLHKGPLETKNIFVRGLRPDIRRYILLQGADTVTQAEELARIFESTALLDKSDNKTTETINVLANEQKTTLSKFMNDISGIIQNQNGKINSFIKKMEQNGNAVPNQNQFPQSEAPQSSYPPPLIAQPFAGPPRQFIQPGQYNSQNNIYCRICRTNTHNTSNCTSNFRPRSQICYRCNRNGHYARNCRQPPANNRAPLPPQQGNMQQKNWPARSSNLRWTNGQY